ncbi:MAG TPA: aminopeptidase P family N-terminal domain-containing protein [Methylomirabilota bacterium]|nr:aminopeptidase P family N-terminal domain-containing protein [Methylomirabilota bacterium]
MTAAGRPGRSGRPVARLADVDLPEFGRPTATPELDPPTYRARLERVRARMAEAHLDRLVIYADREHSANLAWLTGFDPRFEEAILIVGPDGDPAVLVGNECYGVAGVAPLPMRREWFQDLSLPGQPRDKSRPLAMILADEGIGPGRRVGVVAWKTYADPALLDAPSFLADAVRAAAGSPGNVVNATRLFIDAADGLRVINEVEQLAVMEAAACTTSSGVRSLLTQLRPGLRERDAVGLLGWDGTPLSCHLMLTAGPRARWGLLSPGDRAIERGDPFTVAFGVWGALTCRAGFVVEDAAGLPDGIGDYVDRLVGPYFAAIAEWYETLHVGQTGGALFEVVDRHLRDPFFGIFLNPGHQIQLDEWVNSPISRGSTTELRSGMAFQVDVIPATGTPYFTTNIEDGIALADSTLREAFAARHPEAWSRIQARRRFMTDALGIDLHPDVLPFSNIPAFLPPFLLRPDRAMTVAR